MALDCCCTAVVSSCAARPMIVPRSKLAVEKSTKIRRDSWLVGWPSLCYDAHSQTCGDMAREPLMELLMVLAAAPFGNPLGSTISIDASTDANRTTPSGNSNRTHSAASSDANRAAPRLRIEWDGAENCRPTNEVLDGLRRLLGTDPELLLDEPLLVSANIQTTSRGWSLALSIPGRRGPIERHIDAASCAELAQAASLIISLWIQPSKPKEPPPDRHVVATSSKLSKLEHAPSGPVEPAAGRRLIPPPELTSRVQLGFGAIRVRSSSRLRLRGFAGVTLLYGALPSAAGGVTAGIAASLKRWEGGLALLWLDSQPITTLEPLSVSGRFGLWATTARIARSYRLHDSLRLQPGIWALVGRLHAEASGSSVQSATPSDGDWGAGGVGLTLLMNLRRFAATLELGGGLPFGRPAFWVGEQLLYQTSAFVGFGTIGMGVSFP